MAHENLRERFTELEKAKERTIISRPKIQRVANYFRNQEHFAQYYTPKLVSMGPIHHGDPNLQLGEQYKLTWAAKYIESTEHTPQVLYKRIADNIEELKGLFATDVFTDFNCASEGFVNLEEKLSYVLFVDGCALLQIMDKPWLRKPEKMNVKVDQLALAMQDVLLLENQLPYPLLKLLWRDNSQTALIEKMNDFLFGHHWATDQSEPEQHGRWKHNDIEEDQQSIVVDVDVDVDVSQDELPTHLLDLQRRIILRNFHRKNEYDFEEIPSEVATHRNMQEMRAAGIRLRSSKTRMPRDISFSRGWFSAELTLPEIVVDDLTIPISLNLMAYEMCPDFVNDYGFLSFVAFMYSLVGRPEDVKTLRSQGILLNFLGSDEEVARLFNIISIHLVPASTSTYSHFKAQIDEHCRNKWYTLVARFHTYFSNPWAIIALHAAELALALTFVQTWFTIHPTKS